MKKRNKNLNSGENAQIRRKFSPKKKNIVKKRYW